MHVWMCQGGVCVCVRKKVVCEMVCEMLNSCVMVMTYEVNSPFPMTCVNIPCPIMHILIIPTCIISPSPSRGSCSHSRCPPRSFIPALCKIFMDAEAPDNVLEVTARALTYYLDVSVDCTRRIIAVDGALKAIIERMQVADITLRTSKDLAEQCIKVKHVHFHLRTVEQRWVMCTLSLPRCWSWPVLESLTKSLTQVDCLL